MTDLTWGDKPISDMTRDELVTAMQGALVQIRELQLALAVDTAAGNYLIYRREYAIRRLRYLRLTGHSQEQLEQTAALFGGEVMGLDPVDLVSEAAKPGQHI